MSKTDRQRQFIEYLKSAQSFPISIQSLAQRFECSERTIRRYIEDHSAKGSPWYILQNAIGLDKSRKQAIQLHDYWFTKEELEALFTLNQIITQLSPGTLKTQLETLISRMSKLLKDETQQTDLAIKVKLIEIADRIIQPQVFQTITAALTENKRIQIEFWSRENNQTTNRTVSPLQLVRYKDNWKIDAWCHQKNALRTFSLEAINQVQLIEKSIKEISPQKIKSHFESSYGIFAGKANKQAVIQFTPYIARWVQYENWHPQQQSQWDKNGNYLLTLPYNQDQELIQDILKFGAHAKVLQPIELKEKIKQKLKETLENYSQ